MAEKFIKFFKLAKVDEATHEVFGVVTSEKPDGDKEIADYEACKKAFKDWSEDFLRKTTAAGQDPSLGNIRLQHSLQIAGKAIKLEFNDDTKQILLGTQPVNDQIWNLIKGGFVTGYSMGGEYVWTRPEGEYRRFAPKISEVSYVDNACNSEATFSYIKADGGMELRKFAGEKKLAKEIPVPLELDLPGLADMVKAELEKEGTKEKGGEEVHESDFAYVGDKQDKSTWKLPVHDKAHAQNALARFDQTEGIPADQKAAVHARIVAAAKKFDIEVKAAKTEKDNGDKLMDLTEEQQAEFKKAIELTPVKEVLEKARHSLNAMLDNLHKSSHEMHDSMIGVHERMKDMHKAHCDKMMGECDKAIGMHQDRKEEVNDHIDNLKKALGVIGGEGAGIMSESAADKAAKAEAEKAEKDRLAKATQEAAEKKAAETAEAERLTKATMEKETKELLEKAQAASKAAQDEVNRLTGELTKAQEAIGALTKAVDEIKQAKEKELEDIKVKQTLIDKEGNKVVKTAPAGSLSDSGI